MAKSSRRSGPLAIALQQAITEHFTVANALRHVLFAKLKQARIRLSTAEKEQITSAIRQCAESGDWSALKELRIERPGRKNASTINLDPSDIEAWTKKVAQKLEALVPKLTKKTARLAFDRYQEQAEIARLATLFESERFRHRLARTYGRAFEAMGRFLECCIDANHTVLTALTKKGGTRQTAKRRALVRMHFRACRVGLEIESLLHAGFSDAAMARWRTLHELCVCAAFIAKRSDDTARRYLKYEAVERAKMERQARGSVNALTPETQREITALTTAYGSEFGKEYGWACHALNKRKVVFRDLEEATDFGRARLHYQKASSVIHASSLSLFYRPGLNLWTEPGNPMEWAVGSNLGLLFPAELCLWTLVNVSHSLLASDLSPDNLVVMELLSRARQKVAREFDRADRRIRARQARLDARREPVKSVSRMP